MAFNHFPHVYEPIEVGSMTVKNRIQFSPIVSNHAGYRDGKLGNELFEFAMGQARTGCGLVTIGSTPVDFDEGRDFYACMSVTTDDDIPPLGLLAREFHKIDCRLSVELTHGGQWAADVLPDDKRAYVPSILDGMDPSRFIEIGRSEMDIVIQHHVDAIERCKKAGLDMVMVHLAHGNLLSSFMSPHWNQRTDEYGGSFENRVRLPLEVLAAAREATGGDIPIEIRLVGNEWIDNGMPFEERVEFLKLAEPYIDMVLVSAGTLRAPIALCKNMPGYYVEPMLNTKYSKALKEACPSLAVSVCGGISTLEQAEHIIESGEADIVAMAKALMADGDYVNKGLRGQEDEIRPCLRCMYCMKGCLVGSHLEGCAVNPIMGWEYRGTKLIPTTKPRKVMVVGAGPGGMEATRVLAERGYEVVLYDKAQQMGGRLPEASALSFKDGFRRYLKWAQDQTAKCGATVKLGVEVTPEVVRAEDPDVLILATGAELIEPPIPGLDKPFVHDVVEVDRGGAEIGQRVVVCGGGLSGMECALGLAMEGKEVTVVDQLPEDEFARDLVFFLKQMLDLYSEQNHVAKRGNCVVQEVVDGGVVVRNQGGETETIPADTVITAFGVRPNACMIEELSSIVPETYVIGDAKEPGVIGDAINQAYWLCRDLA